MAARRYKSLHHNLQEGMNIVFHREHRSKKGRSAVKPGKLQKFERSSRRKFKNYSKSQDFFQPDGRDWKKRRKY